MIDWLKIRKFVNTRTYYCTASVYENDEIRSFPIGSLKVGRNGDSGYFELFAKSVKEGDRINFLAVDVGILFWLRSLLSGKFPHPPAIRLSGQIGPRRKATDREIEGWKRKVGWLLKTKGGQLLWSRPQYLREVTFDRAGQANLGKMTKHLKGWTEQTP